MARDWCHVKVGGYKQEVRQEHIHLGPLVRTTHKEEKKNRRKSTNFPNIYNFSSLVIENSLRNLCWIPALYSQFDRRWIMLSDEFFVNFDIEFSSFCRVNPPSRKLLFSALKKNQ